MPCLFIELESYEIYADAVARRQPIRVFLTSGAAALYPPGFMRKEQQGLEPQPRAQPPG